MFSTQFKSGNEDDKYSLRAAEHIDILTFNRIVDFDKLTKNQKTVILRVHKQLIDFERDNEDLINSYLTSYSVNGVSMSFGNNWNLKIINGVAIPSDIYTLLVSTGLCCAVLR